MSKRLLILVLLAIVIAGVVLLFRTTIGTEILWNISNSGQWLFPLVTISALIDAINPCAFAVLLLTIAFLFSIGKLRRNVLRIGGIYIIGIFLAYILIGLGLLQAFHLFGIPNIMGKLGAVLVIGLGVINILTYLWPSFPIKLKIPSISHHRIATLMEKATLPTVFLLGVLVGLCEFPCTGGPYLMVIGLLHDQATLFGGILYLFWYNILFVLPLVVVLLIVGDAKVIDIVQQWRAKSMKQSRLTAGIIMILLGFLIFAI
ncbi:MAG TPA: GAP family protein [Candidatus Angelobacter sp.]|nr:GAP family protein [Candidatus Angelobacter sp.]